MAKKQTTEKQVAKTKKSVSKPKPEKSTEVKLEATVEEIAEETVEETVEEVVEKVVPKVEVPILEIKQPEARPMIRPRVYRALANLSSNGKSVAKAGDEVVLSEALAAYYNKYSPNSIEEVK